MSTELLLLNQIKYIIIFIFAAASYLAQLLSPSIINLAIRKRYGAALAVMALSYAPLILKLTGVRTWEPPVVVQEKAKPAVEAESTK